MIIILDVRLFFRADRQLSLAVYLDDAMRTTISICRGHCLQFFDLLASQISRQNGMVASELA